MSLKNDILRMEVMLLLYYNVCTKLFMFIMNYEL